MDQQQSSIRFHSLDALRAWAMLLGIVLHAAWFMSTRYFETPITDADGNYFFEYVLYLIHIFRLQAFFLMAGLFAHLVFSRRGTVGFIWHRLSRIAIPLMVGWLLLYPVMMLQYAWGGMLSGRILTDQSLWVTAWRELINSLQVNASSLIHLWFLYDLLVLYALALFVVLVLRKGVDRSGWIRRRLDEGFRRLTRSPWSVVLLAIPSAILLYFEEWWWGIGAYPINFVPEWPGLLGYALFFAVGWLLYAQLDLLTEVSRNWWRNLALGVILSIPLFVATTVIDFSSTPTYPMLDSNSIIGDHQELLAAAREDDDDQAFNPSRLVLHALSPEYREFLKAHDKLSPDQKMGLATELNQKVLSSEQFADREHWKHARLPEDIRAKLTDDTYQHDEAKRSLLNRGLLEASLPGMFLPNFEARRISVSTKRSLASGTGWQCGCWCLEPSGPSPTSSATPVRSRGMLPIPLTGFT